MAILVIEGGRANGDDLVTREARLNPNSQFNGGPQVPIRTLPIGEDLVALGVSLDMAISAQSDEEEPHFCALLCAVGYRDSKLVDPKPVKLILGEVGRIPVSKLREMFTRAIDGQKAPEAAQ